MLWIAPLPLFPRYEGVSKLCIFLWPLEDHFAKLIRLNIFNSLPSKSVVALTSYLLMNLQDRAPRSFRVPLSSVDWPQLFKLQNQVLLSIFNREKNRAQFWISIYMFTFGSVSKCNLLCQFVMIKKWGDGNLYFKFLFGGCFYTFSMCKHVHVKFHFFSLGTLNYWIISHFSCLVKKVLLLSLLQILKLFKWYVIKAEITERNEFGMSPILPWFKWCSVAKDALLCRASTWIKFPYLVVRLYDKNERTKIFLTFFHKT